MDLKWRPHVVPRLGGDRDGGAADAILLGGRVYTGARAGAGPDGGGAPRFAEALALRDGRIARVGGDAEVASLRGPGTEVVDLDGRTVVPGLVDSHVHLVRAGLTWLDEVRWFETPSLAGGLALLDREAARRGAGAWLRVVGGWHPGQFAEGRGPTSEELTRRYPGNPVYVQLLYEEAVLNEAGLRACGITATGGDVPQGTVERDPATGEPTGVVRGGGAFAHCLAQGGEPSFDEQVRGTAQAMELLAGWGVTGAVDAGGLGMPPERYEPLYTLWREGAFSVRTRLYAGAATRGRERDEITGWLRHARPGFGDAWLRHVGVGEIAVFGCHDLEGLTDFEVSPEACEDLEHVCRDVAALGWPLHLHAVLDGTVGAVLDVWERVAAEQPLASLRWSLAHVEPISARNLDRVEALGCGIAVQDRLAYRATASARRWGTEAVRSGPPLRDILGRGIPLGAGTDATRVASPNPWVSLWWLVTGATYDEGPQREAAQCLNRRQALDAYTSGSAWFSFEEHERGRLAPGLLADLAVLSDDYFTVGAAGIRDLEAVLTITDGRVTHAGGPFAGLG